MIDELIERVEEGEGADRGLDAWVCATVRHVQKPRYQYIADLRYEGLEDGSIEAFCVGEDGVERRVERFASRTLTASLDAVLALIEEKLPGAYASIEMGVTGKGNLAEVAIETTNEDRTAFRAEAASPARALLAAFLRAHKEQHDGR